MKILIIGFVVPEPKSSAAGSRTMQLISMFQEFGWNVEFASPAAESEFAERLSDFAVLEHKIILNDSSFDSFVKVLNPDIVVFDRFMMEEQFGWRVAENCPTAMRILDTIDLHCLRSARQQAWKEKRLTERKDLFSDIAKREIASILRCDLTLMIAEYEMKILQKEFKIDQKLLHYLPLFSEGKIAIESLASFDEREDFVFIGNFIHEPNWNAVLFLKESIWPVIRKKLPNANLNIYGAYPTQKVFNLHNESQGFLVKGRAKNAVEVIANAKVCLAPLRFGAGIKGKLLDAMECGTPSVTTSIGAESMHGNLDWNGFIVDEENAFADAAVELYQSAEIWQSAQKNGFEILDKRFSKELFKNDFEIKLRGHFDNLEENRLNNFLGSILLHHSMASTKYMSRWIEEKNK